MRRLAIPPAVELVDPSGERSTPLLGPADHVALYVRALHAHQRRQLTEDGVCVAMVEACPVRRMADGSVRPQRDTRAANFPRLGDVGAMKALAQSTREQGRELWVSPLARGARIPGGASVPGGDVLWADADSPAALWRARALRARLPVRLLVESAGDSDPARPRWHLYLRIDQWLAPPALEAANARLGAMLGGDRVADAGRLMRLPGSLNRKPPGEGRLCHVVAADLHSPPVALTDLPGPPAPLAPAARPRRRPRTIATADALALIAPREWFAALEPDREISEYGFALCPLHDDQTPSLKLYDSPEDGWYCWACTKGGDLIEYAAWRRHRCPARELDGRQFRELRAWLSDTFTAAGAAVAA